MDQCSRMFAEAAETGAAVARQRSANAAAVAEIAASLRAAPPPVVATIARGSSDHAATYAKWLIETRARVPVASLSPSIASVYGARLRLGGALALAISQSGASPDLVAALRMAGEGDAGTLALVNALPSPLAEAAARVLPLHAGPETSVAATKSYVAALAAVADLVAAWSGDGALAEALGALPEALDRAWRADWSELAETLADARSLYVVGRGPSLGIAQEAALKFKETCAIHAEAFSAAELRHGPMALVGPEMPLLVFRPGDASAAAVDALVAAARERGARVLVAGESLPVEPAHAAIAPILAIQSFYRAVEALARRRGRDPDRPPHLSKVTETV